MNNNPFIESGIYKITNNLTGKSYIGQSKNIQKRYLEHIHHKDTDIDKDIRELGLENFTFEILELCDESQLNEREDYYILKFDSIDNGYNKIRGGQDNIGESNSNSILKESDIYFIRECYKHHMRQRDAYEYFKDKITFGYFRVIWEGTSWNYIHMDVYTEENKKYYSSEATNGELSDRAIFSNDEILELRKRYVNETASEIYESVKDKCKYNTLQQILWGRTYKDIPIYDKKSKKWIQ